jgi:WD40 repeat protein
VIRLSGIFVIFALGAFAQQPTEVVTLDTPSPIRHGVSLSLSGQLAAASCADGKLRVWSLPSGKVTRTIDPGNRLVFSTAISHDGALVAGASADPLATGGEAWEGGYTVWNTATGAQIFRIGRPHPASAIAFSPDGKRLAIAPANEPTLVYSLDAGTKLFELPQEFGGAQAVAFSRDGLRIATADSDTIVRVFDARNGELLSRFQDFLLEPFAAAFTADGKRLLTGGGDKVLAVVDVLNGSAVQKSPKLADPVQNLNVSPDGALAAVWLMHADNTSQPAPVLITETDSGHTVQQWKPPSSVVGTAWTDDRHLLAAIRVDKSVHIWRVR